MKVNKLLWILVACAFLVSCAVELAKGGGTGGIRGLKAQDRQEKAVDSQDQKDSSDKKPSSRSK